MIYTLNLLFDHVYHINFKRHKDLWTTFYRSQEFYESPVFMNRAFYLCEHQNWYSSKHGQFSYSNDYHAFNVDGNHIAQALTCAPDWCKYDEQMLDVMSQIPEFFDPLKNFYLIGTSDENNENNSFLLHELAHGLYFSNEDYRNEINCLIMSEIPKDVRYNIWNYLKESGYNEERIWDEFQAYITTGFENDEKEKLIKPYEIALIKTFKKYVKDIII